MVLGWKLESSLFWRVSVNEGEEIDIWFNHLIVRFALKYLDQLFKTSLAIQESQRHILVPLCRTMNTISSLLIIFHYNNSSNNDYNPMMRIKLMRRRSVYIAISRPSQAGRPVPEQALPVGRSMHCAADQLVAMTMIRTMIMMMMMMILLSHSLKNRHQSQHHFYLKGSVLSDKVQ